MSTSSERAANEEDDSTSEEHIEEEYDSEYDSELDETYDGASDPSDSDFVNEMSDEAHHGLGVDYDYESDGNAIDSSAEEEIEDGDEDMFDDDAFYFGDEDFEALMSHESMKRPRPGLGRINNAPASAALADENSQSPLQHSASMFNDLGIGGVAASSSSTAASSYGKFS